MSLEGTVIQLNPSLDTPRKDLIFICTMFCACRFVVVVVVAEKNQIDLFVLPFFVFLPVLILFLFVHFVLQGN